MLDRLGGLLPLVLAVIVPLAGAFLAIYALQQGQRDEALRIGLATLLGVCLYALVVSL